MIQDEKPIYTEIGRWIDGQLDNEELKSSVQHFTARNMELLEIEEGSVFIPTTDADGKVTWGPITAITRHDPGTELYEIKTKAGRSVIVTESKSLLVWHPESKTFLEKPTPEIKVGDFVPVTKELCQPPVVLQEYKRLLLNYETGIVLGLSLAEWKSGQVFYAEEPDFDNFVREYMDKDTQCILEAWLQEPVIPSEAFIADESFVLGIINGFFSINGNVEQDRGIYAFSEHLRLLEGISMLLSRVGIFASIQKENNMYTLSIRGTQAQRFAELVELLDEEKGRVWRNMDMEVDQQQQEYNDVVLDPIVEINIMGIEKHPKVYDLTIPTTLNFGLANGLQVRDTSTTGYIQRRLIKGLEDLMVSYDMTLRTNKNKIVQFCYGEDAVDTTKVENQILPLVKMTIQEIYAHFNLPEDAIKAKDLTIVFEKSTWKRFKSQQNKANEYCKKYTDYMLEARGKIVEHVFKKKGDDVVNCPVAFQYIIGNIQGQQNIHSNSVVDVTFAEAFEMIEHTFHNLETLVYAPPTELFKTLYFYYLSPKDLLLVKRFNRGALTLLLTTISLMYKRASVAPGEMVGMIAAQSIGEVSTQMTLNSFTYETEIVVRNREGHVKKVQMGKFIEEKIKIATKKEYYEDKDTTYAELDDYMEMPSCDEDGNVMWKRIEAVTRHPVINKDGTNTMLRVTTREEREINATKAKSFLKLVNGKLLPFEGENLKVGDFIPVSTKRLDYTERHELDLKTIMPPTEYLYTSEVDKAKALMHEHSWWKRHQGSTFVLPYNRSDSFVAKISEKLRHGCNTKTMMQSGFVYMLNTNRCDYTIPETIPLDYNFGYLVGAYAAEGGSMTKSQISIANNDAAYFEPILELCKSWNITTKVYRHENKNQKGWTSQDLRIYNTFLCRLLDILCGKLSHNKFVEDVIVYSNKDCMMGFLDAYIAGDGSINKKGKSIVMNSVSKTMLIDIQNMLGNIGVYSYINKYKKQETNNRGSENIYQMYTIMVRNEQAKHLASMLNMKLKNN